MPVMLPANVTGEDEPVVENGLDEIEEGGGSSLVRDPEGLVRVPRAESRARFVVGHEDHQSPFRVAGWGRNLDV